MRSRFTNKTNVCGASTVRNVLLPLRLLFVFPLVCKPCGTDHECAAENEECSDSIICCEGTTCTTVDGKSGKSYSGDAPTIPPPSGIAAVGGSTLNGFQVVLV